MAQLSISARPRTLDDLVGQEKLVKRIRAGIKKRGVSKGYLFWGEKGSGKTSIARILALSFQCTHQDKFGRPCKVCYKNRAKFPIFELPGARVRGVEDVDKFVERARYEILGKGTRKVFIIDEAQQLSKTAQGSLLDITEDGSSNAVFIFTTTDPSKVIDTVRSRLKVRAMLSLDRDATYKLILTLLKRVGSELDPDPLADALVENGITSARLITQATESYIEGATPEDAAEVDITTNVSSKALCRSVVKGSWEDVSTLLKKSTITEVRSLRSAVIGYLRVVLLESPTIDDRSKAVAEAIKRLAYVGSAEEANQMGALAAELFTLCGIFGEYSL